MFSVVHVRIFFPGGATWFNQTNGYADAGKFLYKFAKEKRLPIWGTCLGFELLLYVAAEGQEIRIDCDSKKRAVPIELTEGKKNTRRYFNV